MSALVEERVAVGDVAFVELASVGVQPVNATSAIVVTSANVLFVMASERGARDW
jgi:hypothetical protein